MRPVDVDAFDAQANIAVNASLAISIFFVYSERAPFRPVTYGCGQVIGCFQETASSEGCSVALHTLHHRSVHALDEYRRLPPMPCTVSAPGAIP